MHSFLSAYMLYLHVGKITAFAPNLLRHKSNPLVDAPAKRFLHTPPSTISIPFSTSVKPSPSTTSTSLASANLLPFIYTGFSGTLLYRATSFATNPSEKIVLVAVALLSFLNFGPSDNAKLASAKRAYKQTNPSSAGKEKRARQAALTWRKAVRIKIVGQVAGLVKMATAREPSGVMRGAALLMGGIMMYIISGGGRAYHDNDGNWTPLSGNTVLGILTMDAAFFGAALIAARKLTASLDHSSASSGALVAASVYAFGAIGGAMEGIPQFIKAIKPKKEEPSE